MFQLQKKAKYYENSTFNFSEEKKLYPSISQVSISTVSGEVIVPTTNLNNGNLLVNSVQQTKMYLGLNYLAIFYNQEKVELGTMIFKYTSKPVAKCSAFISDQSIIIKGSYSNIDFTEKIARYRFRIIKATDGAEIYDTGFTVHENINDTYEASFDYLEFFYNDAYQIEYQVETQNGLLLTASVITTNLIQSGASNRTWSPLNIETDESQHCVNISANNSSKVLHPLILLRRKVGDDLWERISTAMTSPFVYNDYFLESNTPYEYASQEILTNKVTVLLKSEGQFSVFFEDILLYDGLKQYSIKFNPQISSIKDVRLESKANTLGNRYPFFFRNDAVGYREFPISGLISVSAEEAFTQEKENNQSLYQLHSNDGIKREKDYREELYNWLNNGEEKYFRSPTEKSCFIRLMNVSLAPNQILGRALYTFSATATESSGESLKKKEKTEVEGTVYYTLTFDNNILPSVSKPAGTKIELAQYTISNEDNRYRYEYWYSDSNCQNKIEIIELNENTTIYYKRIEQCTITFVPGNGENEFQETQDKGRAIELPTFKDKNKQRFKGWFTDQNIWSHKITSPYTLNGNITVYAKWVALHTVKFYDGENIYTGWDQTVEHGERVTRPSDPKKDKFVFVSWFDSKTGGNEYNFSTSVKSDFNLYAKWDEETVLYTLTFITIDSENQQTVYQNISKNKDSTINLVDYLVPENYDGWYKEKECITRITTITLTENTTVYAKEKPLYILIFDTDGGSKINEVKSTQGSEIDLSQYKTEKTGYRFIGWFKNKTDKNSITTIILTESITTVYAKWEEDFPSPTIKYTLTFETNGGTSINSVTADEGTEIDLSNQIYKPTKKRNASWEPQNYKFIGWYKDAEFKQQCNSTISLNESQTIYAKWGDSKNYTTTVKPDSSQPLFFQFLPRTFNLSVQGIGGQKKSDIRKIRGSIFQIIRNNEIEIEIEKTTRENPSVEKDIILSQNENSMNINFIKSTDRSKENFSSVILTLTPKDNLTPQVQATSFSLHPVEHQYLISTKEIYYCYYSSKDNKMYLHLPETESPNQRKYELKPHYDILYYNLLDNQYYSYNAQFGYQLLSPQPTFTANVNGENILIESKQLYVVQTFNLPGDTGLNVVQLD